MSKYSGLKGTEKAQAVTKVDPAFLQQTGWTSDSVGAGQPPRQKITKDNSNKKNKKKNDDEDENENKKKKKFPKKKRIGKKNQTSKK